MLDVCAIHDTIVVRLQNPLRPREPRLKNPIHTQKYTNALRHPTYGSYRRRTRRPPPPPPRLQLARSLPRILSVNDDTVHEHRRRCRCREPLPKKTCQKVGCSLLRMTGDIARVRSPPSRFCRRIKSATQTTSTSTSIISATSVTVSMLSGGMISCCRP